MLLKIYDKKTLFIGRREGSLLKEYLKNTKITNYQLLSRLAGYICLTARLSSISRLWQSELDLPKKFIYVKYFFSAKYCIIKIFLAQMIFLKVITYNP